MKVLDIFFLEPHIFYWILNRGKKGWPKVSKRPITDEKSKIRLKKTQIFLLKNTFANYNYNLILLKIIAP
jgi:hypothetical protein